MDSIFSTYSTGENRVTASIMAVLRSLSLDRMERLIGGVLEEDGFELILFRNQPSGNGEGVPDASISSSFHLLLETKIKANAVNRQQLLRHLERFTNSPYETKKLLVLTPDSSEPTALAELRDRPITWRSFADFSQAIDSVLCDPMEVVSEREAFLLRQLQAMLESEGLLRDKNDVVIVAARVAWPEYNEFHAYVCQPGRKFRQVDRMGFYSHGRIHPRVPKIIERFESVLMEKGKYSGELGALVDKLIETGKRRAGESFEVILLSSPESAETLQLKSEVLNATTSKSGKNTAFTMGQRYVSSQALLNAKTTADLKET